MNPLKDFNYDINRRIIALNGSLEAIELLLLDETDAELAELAQTAFCAGAKANETWGFEDVAAAEEACKQVHICHTRLKRSRK